MKRIIALFLCAFICLGLTSCGNNNLELFYEKVVESQKLLDGVGDDIYENWYECIYNDAFSDDINVAVASALKDNEENLATIETLETEITELFNKIKDGKQGNLVKDVMSAYSDYYEFVVNVSGSFSSYKEDKEKLKKELASLIKDLSYEI